MKPTKCKMKQDGCEGSYIKWSLTQKTCNNPLCAIELMQQEKAKKARKSHLAAKVKARSRGEWLKLAQQAFNAWIRKRDHGKPCISCGTTANVQYCAGHYRTVGACPELRFEPLNVHLQCNKNCNMEKSGNIIEYRIRLSAKIGAESLAWLEGYHAPKKYTIPELQAIIAEYKAKLKSLG